MVETGSQRLGCHNYTYRVEWSLEDSEFVGLVEEFPSLSWLAPSEDEALRGIIEVVEQVVTGDENGTAGGGDLR